jgi:uncharacterized protein YegL
METKTNSEMLKSIKSSNKAARETRAIKLGFKDAATMIVYLEEFISLGKGNDIYIPTNTKNIGTIKEKESTRVTIHVVDILDASGSMFGPKYDAAVKGINIGIKNLKKDKAKVDYTYTLCDFATDIIFRSRKEKLYSVNQFKGETRGSTALYDAIGESCYLIEQDIKPTDKVLVNIYTDGQENASRVYNAKQISEIIEKLSEKGWTFTFIGTKQDVAYAQANLKFHDSNTLIHDNTGAGLEKAFTTNSASRYAYSQKVEAGEDVSKGFYKDIN